MPKHLISAELAWRAGGWRVGPNLRWLPGEIPIDHANIRSYVIRNQVTLAQPGYLPGVGRSVSAGLTWRF